MVEMKKSDWSDVRQETYNEIEAPDKPDSDSTGVAAQAPRGKAGSGWSAGNDTHNREKESETNNCSKQTVSNNESS